MKEKSVTDTHFFDFAQTKDALGELSKDIIALETAIKLKQADLDKEKESFKEMLRSKESALESLKTSVQNALEDIDSINSRIEEVL